jgi:hypothetical protein
MTSKRKRTILPRYAFLSRSCHNLLKKEAGWINEFRNEERQILSSIVPWCIKQSFSSIILSLKDGKVCV